MSLGAAEQDGEVAIQVAFEVLGQRRSRRRLDWRGGGGETIHELLEVEAHQPQGALRTEHGQEDERSTWRLSLR